MSDCFVAFDVGLFVLVGYWLFVYVFLGGFGLIVW